MRPDDDERPATLAIVAAAQNTDRRPSNAAKYGALSTPAGRLQVRWDIIHEEGARKLSLEWTENGGPPAQERPTPGFGSTLLRRVLGVQCNAEVTFQLDESGLRFRMVAPLVERRLVPTY